MKGGAAMHSEFRAGERVMKVESICCECGGDADAYASFEDGSGDMCESCCAKDAAAADPGEMSFSCGT